MHRLYPNLHPTCADACVYTKGLAAVSQMLGLFVTQEGGGQRDGAKFTCGGGAEVGYKECFNLMPEYSLKRNVQ